MSRPFQHQPGPGMSDPRWKGRKPALPRREGPKFGDRNDPRRDRARRALLEQYGRGRRPRPPMFGGPAEPRPFPSRPRPPRRRTVKGSRPRPPMPSPRPPRRGPMPPRRSDGLSSDKERRALLIGGRRPPMGGGGRPPMRRPIPLPSPPRRGGRPPMRGGGIRRNDDFTRGSGMALQVITPWVNKKTGETWNAPNSGFTPREGSGWEIARGGGKSQEQIIAERKPLY